MKKLCFLLLLFFCVQLTLYGQQTKEELHTGFSIKKEIVPKLNGIIKSDKVVEVKNTKSYEIVVEIPDTTNKFHMKGTIDNWSQKSADFSILKTWWEEKEEGKTILKCVLVKKNETGENTLFMGVEYSKPKNSVTFKILDPSRWQDSE